MFSKKSLVLPIALVFLCFVGVSAAQDDTQCYTVASLNGTYGVVGDYGAHVAIALATRHLVVPSSASNILFLISWVLSQSG